MQTTFIYGLECPITKEIKYIGKSNSPKNRVKQHLYETTRQKNYNTHKIKWFEFLKKNKTKPNLVILDEVSLNEWGFWELWWLQICKTWGFEMVNLLEGGDGCSKHSNETIEKICQAQSGENNAMYGKPSPKGFIGKTHSEDSKKKIGEANKGNKVWLGKTHSEETRKKISESNRGKSRNRGRIISEETKQKISNSTKNRKPSIYGKTYEEFYGVEKAKELKNNLSEHGKKNVSEKAKNNLKKHNNNIKNKRYEDVYDMEKVKEIKRKISEKTKGEKNGFYGRKHSPETIEKMKQSHKKRLDK